MTSRRLTECVYCGSEESLTRDHVPPKGLFSLPLPTNLLTVPCCLSCKGEYELEDEYFRLYVASRKESRGHDEAAQAGERAFRRLMRPGSTGFRQAVVDSMVTLEPSTHAAAPEGQLGVFMVDFSRLNRYAVRTIKALFAHHWGTRIPEVYAVVAYCEDMASFTEPEMQARLGRMLHLVRPAQRHASARDILRYKFVTFLADDEIASIWALSYFHYTAFIGAVVPRRGVA